MSLIYGLNEFKEKLKTCDDSGGIRVVYEVIADQVERAKKSISEDKLWAEQLHQRIQENENRLKEIDLAAYKGAMVDRLREIAGK